MSKIISRSNFLNRKRVKNFRRNASYCLERNKDETDMLSDNSELKIIGDDTILSSNNLDNQSDTLQDTVSDNDDQIFDAHIISDCGSESGSEKAYNEGENEFRLTDDLKTWAIESRVPHSTLDSLLHVLRRYHPELPKSSKTLFKTKACLDFEKSDLDSSSQLVYFGISQHLQSMVNVDCHKNNVLNL